jgi:A/G-specific adenine glycosylase
VPGVGRYTAGAVTSIAFGAKAPVVDGNVMRVLCRMYALAGNPLKAPLAGRLWELAESLLVGGAPGDVNQALMELGATVCTPKAPKCPDCPWQSRCRALAQGEAQRYPELPERPKPTQVVMACAVLSRKDSVLLARAPEDAPRWASMWLFPTVLLAREGDATLALGRELLDRYGIRGRSVTKLGVFKHAVTRYRITLHAYACRVDGAAQPREPARWWPRARLEELALPAVHRRIAELLCTPKAGV